MDCTDRKKRVLIYLTAKLMSESGIAIRDTWDGFDGKNNDDVITNQKKDGPKLLEIVVTDEGTTSLKTEWYPLDGFNSLAYERSKIIVPRRLSDKMHPFVHEAVHFLQHSTAELENSYFNVKSDTLKHFKQFVSQKAEYEAHYIQLLFMTRYELDITNQVLLKDYKKRLHRAMRFPAERIGFICWAHAQQIV